MNKLIKMILESKAIDTPEGKQHWINQLEIMTPEATVNQSINITDSEDQRSQRFKT